MRGEDKAKKLALLEEQTDILELINSGKTVSQVSAITGKTPGVIHRTLNKLLQYQTDIFEDNMLMYLAGAMNALNRTMMVMMATMEEAELSNERMKAADRVIKAAKAIADITTKGVGQNINVNHSYQTLPSVFTNSDPEMDQALQIIMENDDIREQLYLEQKQSKRRRDNPGNVNSDITEHLADLNDDD